MDEIEYKLNTNNSVLVVNAIDKLISAIKLKFKPAERQRFVLENEELKLLREKCSSKEVIVSLTACQGLLALVELGVLEIAHTMSTVVTLLPSAHNYSAIVSTMTGLLILDLKSRLVPGQEYKCQFTLKSPQHPFITVLERNKGTEDDVLTQMQALCTHSDYTVSSNSLELLRPVFLYLTCNPQREGSIRPWQLLLSLPKTDAQCCLLLACLSCQQICNPTQMERAFSAYSLVTDAAIYQRDEEYVAALMPMLARIANELVKHGRDPRPCYRLVARCAELRAAGLRAAAGVAAQLLAADLPNTSALYLHDVFNLCLSLITIYEIPAISVNAFVAQSLQWLHLPSYLTTSALKVAANILDIYKNNTKEDTALNIPNLMSNKIFQSLLYTDNQLSVIVKLHSVWESIRDDERIIIEWLNGIESIHDSVKVDLLPFFYGILMEKNNAFESVTLKVLKMVVDLVDFKKEVAVELLPILVYKVANDVAPVVRLECLKAVPLMAKSKENVPTIVSVLNKLKTNKGVPTSVLIMLYCRLAETQVRCFPYLQEILADTAAGRPDDLKWEVDIARVHAVRTMCRYRASSHGLELVSIISTTLNRCGERSGGAACCLALDSVRWLWRQGALQPASAWRALEPRLVRDQRPAVQIYVCKLLSCLPALQSSSSESAALCAGAARRLWQLIAGGAPPVVGAACRALAHYNQEAYVLKDIPEIYRKTVKLPASHCKTPVDAARKPEDVLDYVPCEVWPEVFKYTNQAALPGVVTLVRGLIEREVRGYRSGVYHAEGGAALPAHSVPRGVGEGLRKQITSPSYECPDTATLAMLETLAGEFPKPLPPFDMHYLAELVCRGGQWRQWVVTLAARQAKVSPSAKEIVENWVLSLQSGHAEETDVILFYELLPILTRSLPPNTLRGPLERTLSDAFSLIAKTKAKEDYATFVLKQTLANLSTIKQKRDLKKKSDENSNEKKSLTQSDSLSSEESTKQNSLRKSESLLSSESDGLVESEDSLFEKQLKLIKKCLELEIHDANRTLLSQQVEKYFAIITDDNVAWPTYVETCRALSTSYLERMTSPSGWWSVSEPLVRSAGAVRAAVAVDAHCDAPLMWLNDIVDVLPTLPTVQDTFVYYMFPALLAADPSSSSSREWLLQLMARTQVAFNETEDNSAKLYLFSVFVCVMCVWSGHWALHRDVHAALRGAGLPGAVHAVLSYTALGDCAVQVLEWVCHTRGAVPATSAWCQRALLAARHTQAAQRGIWTRLESHFGKEIVVES